MLLRFFKDFYVILLGKEVILFNLVRDFGIEMDLII